jgi:hypothetical protein
MSKFDSIGSGLEYGYDQVYAGFEAIDNGILWQFAKRGYLDSNKEEITAFNTRFNHQWFVGIPEALVSASKHINPLTKIIEIVSEQYTRTHSEKDLMDWVVVYAGRGIRVGTRQLIIQSVLTVIARKILAREAIRKSTQFAVGFVSLGLSVAAAEQGMEMKSYESARDLRLVKPHLYALLYSANVETFWFLVQNEFSALTRSIS